MGNQTEFAFAPPVQHPFSGTIFDLAKSARRSLTLLESRFWSESTSRWPSVHWKRYAPITIRVHPYAPSIWYAPFLCADKKLIVVIEDQPDFPYRIFGENWALYAAHGYTLLDFSQDFSAPWDESVWGDAMAKISATLRELRGIAYELAEGRDLTAQCGKPTRGGRRARSERRSLVSA
jgi:hypothetical protein